MDAGLTGIARRFVACPKWVWLPGLSMRRVIGGGGISWRRLQHADDAVWANAYCRRKWYPDLDDETTCAAIMPVIRRAWNDPHAFVRFFDRAPLEGHWFWECGVGSRRQCGFVADVKHGELLAMLAALESAK